MDKKLQILMPVYNEADHIEKILVEIYKVLNDKIPFEFIISEDGSKDGTKEILKNLKNKLPITLISEEERKFYSKAVIDGIMKLSIDNKKPIGNGIITCLNKEQALNRKKKGKEAAVAVLSVLDQDQSITR